MDPTGALLDCEWDSFHKMFAAEEFEFTAHPFLGQGQFLLGQDEEVNLGIHSMVLPPLEVNISMFEANENLVYSSESLNSYSVQSISQQSTYNCPLSTHSANILASDPNCMYMDIPSVEDICAFSSCSLADMMMDDTARLDEASNGNIAVIMNPSHQPYSIAIPRNQMNLKRKLEAQELPCSDEDKSNTNAENQKKKPRVSREVQRTKRNAQPKKNHKQNPHANVEDDQEMHAATSAGQSDSSCSTEEDSASQEMNGGGISSCNASAALHSNGKTRASRGSATDSQSLYARKRRERINERLRILQNLVPNGTKVDISTMLEEAVHYVKFLQLQIKLLSSDDHWMYAPIAYNGMDMGLNLHMKIPSPL